MASIVYLTTSNMPNSKFKFSKVDQKTVSVDKSIDSKINTFASNAKKVSTSFASLANVLKKEISNNRKSYDSTSLNNLEKLSKGVTNQAEYVEKRSKALQELIKKDTNALREKAEKAAWKALLTALLSDPGLSASTKNAIEEYMKKM